MNNKADFQTQIGQQMNNRDSITKNDPVPVFADFNDPFAKITISDKWEGVTPTNLQMMGSAIKAAADWTKSGFPIPDPETFNARLETCKGCEFWDESGFAKTGRCRKCGCSTQAKLRMATEKCPIGKW
jgi:hypothetical protein